MSWLLPGYTLRELEDAQDRFDLQFPPDLIELYLTRRPANGYDWRTDLESINKMLLWPLEGLLFDVEHNNLWLPIWGECPVELGDRFNAVKRLVAQAPKLIPLYSHRYLPSYPCEAGNPVFSIYQADIIYYGADLAHYFGNETDGWSALAPEKYRHIPFWSDLVEQC